MAAELNDLVNAADLAAQMTSGRPIVGPADHRVLRIRLADPADLDAEFLSSWQHLYDHCQSPHFQQSHDWYRCIADKNKYSCVVTVCDGRFTAFSLIRELKIPVLNKFKYFIDHGPIALDADALQVHVADLHASLAGCAAWIRVSPYATGAARLAYERVLEQNGFCLNPDPATYSSTLVVQLRDSLPEIRRGFRRSLKTQLNKAGRLEIGVADVDSEEEFAEILHSYNSVKGLPADAGIGGLDQREFFQRFLKSGEAGVCKIARRGSQLLAGIIVLSAGDRAIYQWGFSNKREATGQPLAHSLHWEAIKWAKARGLALYDLGGYWSERGAGDPINRFKRGFSGEIQDVLAERQRRISLLANVLLRSAAGVRSAASMIRS